MKRHSVGCFVFRFNFWWKLILLLSLGLSCTFTLFTGCSAWSEDHSSNGHGHERENNHRWRMCCAVNEWIFARSLFRNAKYLIECCSKEDILLLVETQSVFSSNWGQSKLVWVQVGAVCWLVHYWVFSMCEWVSRIDLRMNDEWSARSVATEYFYLQIEMGVHSSETSMKLYQKYSIEFIAIATMSKWRWKIF